MSSIPHIQSYAQVIGVDTETFDIVCYSDNIPGLVGGAAGAGLPRISNLFSEATLHAARASAARPYPLAIRLTDREPTDWGRRQIIPHRVEECLLLEIEPYGQPRPLTTDLLQTSELALSAALDQADSMQSIMEIGCHQLTELFGLERGCFYQLDYPGGPGQITAEVLTGGLPPMSGVHFRKEDFPDEGYRKVVDTPVLFYTNDGQPPVEVKGDTLPFAPTINYRIGARTPFTAAVDFTHNNDLGVYVIVAINSQGRLLGLLCGHSRQVHTLDHQHRLYLYRCKLELERALANLNDRRQFRTHRAVDQRRDRTRQSIGESAGLFQGLTEAVPPLIDYPGSSTGVAVSIDGELSLSGMTPDKKAVVQLLEWAKGQGTDGELYVTDCLPVRYPPSVEYQAVAAGVLLLPLGRERTDWIVWFRPEMVTMTEYGSLEWNGSAPSLGKRYTKIIEPRRGHSLPWAEEQIAAARELQTFIQEVAIGRYNKLSRINKQLSTAYAELEDFSYTVSHDLRAPLRGIDGYAEILMEDYRGELSDEAADLVRIIQDNAARMNQSITDILELSRVGRIKLKIESCDVEGLVKEATQEVSRQIGEPVEVSVLHPLPRLRGDNKQMLLVFKHLLSNAAKYSSKQAERHITVGFRQEGGMDKGQFFVSDNGIGIPLHHQERIFGMFNRLVVEKDYAGNGVGLAIVKRIVHRHNGRISIESEVGRGATFLFYTDPEVPKKR